MELLVITDFSNNKGTFKRGDIIKVSNEEGKLLKQQKLAKEYVKIETAKLEPKKETATKKKKRNE